MRGVGDGHGGRRLQHPVTGRPRSGAGLRGQRLGSVVVAAGRPLARHREGERRRRPGGGVAVLGPLGLQQTARLLAVVQPQSLEIRERLHDRDPLAARLGREHGEHPPQHVAGLHRTPANTSARPWVPNRPRRR